MQPQSPPHLYCLVLSIVFVVVYFYIYPSTVIALGYIRPHTKELQFHRISVKLSRSRPAGTDCWVVKSRSNLQAGGHCQHHHGSQSAVACSRRRESESRGQEICFVHDGWCKEP